RPPQEGLGAALAAEQGDEQDDAQREDDGGEHREVGEALLHAAQDELLFLQLGGGLDGSRHGCRLLVSRFIRARWRPGEDHATFECGWTTWLGNSASRPLRWKLRCTASACSAISTPRMSRKRYGISDRSLGRLISASSRPVFGPSGALIASPAWRNKSLSS